MSETIDNETIEKIGTAVTNIRELVDEAKDNRKGLEDKLNQLDSESKEKYEKLETELKKLDEDHQKSLGDKAEVEKREKEAGERFENLENQLLNATKSGVEKIKDTVAYKGFKELLCKGSLDQVDVQYKEALRTDQGSEGGFLVPETLADDIRKKIEEISPVRQFARVRTSMIKTLNIPIRNSIPEATYEGEAEESGTSKEDYRSESQTAHRLTTTVPITRDLLNFSGFNMETEIFADVSTAFAQKEGNKFLLGSGVKQPEGIITRAGAGDNDVPFTETESSGVVSLDDVIKLAGEQKLGYNSIYSFNRKTLTELRTERDSNGNYLWTFGAERFPTQINGFDYVLMQDLGDIAVGAFPVLFGDYFNGYNILDAVQMEVVRDEVTRKKEAIVEFTWFSWNDGRVVLGEAFQLLKVKA